MMVLKFCTQYCKQNTKASWSSLWANIDDQLALAIFWIGCWQVQISHKGPRMLLKRCFVSAMMVVIEFASALKKCSDVPFQIILPNHSQQSPQLKGMQRTSVSCTCFDWWHGGADDRSNNLILRRRRRESPQEVRKKVPCVTFDSRVFFILCSTGAANGQVSIIFSAPRVHTICCFVLLAFVGVIWPWLASPCMTCWALKFDWQLTIANSTQAGWQTYLEFVTAGIVPMQSHQFFIWVGLQFYWLSYRNVIAWYGLTQGDFLLFCRKCSCAADMWSFGKTGFSVFSILSCHRPFSVWTGLFESTEFVWREAWNTKVYSTPCAAQHTEHLHSVCRSSSEQSLPRPAWAFFWSQHAQAGLCKCKARFITCVVL